MSVSIRVTVALFGAACVGVCVSASAVAGVIVVDSVSHPPFDFNQIAPAVAAAVDGDVILVRDGTYDQFTVAGKSLTITADASASVDVAATPNAALPAITIDGFTGPTRVTLRGMAVVAFPGSTTPTTGIAVKSGASCWFEEISVDGFNTGLDLFQSSLVAHGCSFYGAIGDQALVPTGGNGIVAQDATLTLHAVAAVGGQGADATSLGTTPGTGGVGMTLTTATLFASGSQFAGGQGGGGVDFGGPCVGGGDGGVGLQLVAGDPAVVLLETSVDGGPMGGGAGACVHGLDGQPTDVASGSIAEEPGTARGYFIQSPVREGNNVTMKFTGEPGDACFMFFGAAFGTVTATSFSGALHVGLPVSVVALPTLVSAGNVLTIPLPALPPSIDGVTIYTQPAYVDVNGIAYLHAPSALIMLDSSF